MKVKQLASTAAKLPVFLVLAAVLVLPAVVSVAAESGAAEDELAVANLDANGDLVEEQVVDDTSTETPVEEPEVPVEEPTEESTEPPATEEQQQEVEPEEETTSEEDEDEAEAGSVVLARFESYAQAEVPGATIEGGVFVYKKGIKAAKFTMSDGSKVYIAVDSRSTLAVADEDGHIKRCQKRFLRHKYYRWYKKYDSYHSFWKHYQKNPQEATEGIEATDSDTEASDADESADTEVQAAVTSTDNSRKDKSKKHDENRKKSRRGSWDYYYPWGNYWRR